MESNITFDNYNELLRFWFNDHKKNWFGCPPHIDELIKNKFLNIDLGLFESGLLKNRLFYVK